MLLWESKRYLLITLYKLPVSEMLMPRVLLCFDVKIFGLACLQ
jgi:hypothetical protein